MKKTRCVLLVVGLVLALGLPTLAADGDVNEEAIALWAHYRCCVPLENIDVQFGDGECCVSYHHSVESVTQRFRVIWAGRTGNGFMTYDLVSLSPAMNYFYSVVVDLENGTVQEIVAQPNESLSGNSCRRTINRLEGIVRVGRFPCVLT